MTSLRTPILRHINATRQLFLRPAIQRRNAQVHDARNFALHAHKQNKFVDRYKAKLERKAAQVGVRDVDELLDKSREESVKKAQQAHSPSQTQPEAANTSPWPAPPPPPSPVKVGPDGNVEGRTRSSANAEAARNLFKQKEKVKTLGSFIDVEKVAELPSKEIEAIWRLRHASNPRSLCASIPAPLFARIALTARKHPQFILPIPRTAAEDGQPAPQAGEIGDGTGGADIHFLQWTFPSPTTATVLFTHLAEFKLKGEYAAPHTTITHHTDFAMDKEMVLVEGSVMPDRGVSVAEAKWLVMCLQKFYGAFEKESEERAVRRGELLKQFSSGDSQFEVAKLLEEAERIG